MTSATSRPNIIVILADDLGYSDIGAYGGEIDTPNLDRLAAEGTRLTQFYNTARCSPSRASLLTGLHPHQTGIGILTGDDGEVGYPGDLRTDATTIAEMLRAEGYRTAVTGKWHLSADVWNPSHSWPTRRGFDEFFGTVAGCGSYYAPGTLVRGETPIPEETEDPEFYYTDAIGREAVSFVERTAADREPFLLYVPFTAPHWPLHAPEEAVAKYAHRFDDGWDVLRAQRLQRQIELGIAVHDAQLSPRDPREPAWDDADDHAWQARRMEVYAAQVDLMDAAIGSILDALDRHGIADDTIVIFLSDNGASPEELPHIPDFRSHTEFFSPTTRAGEEVGLGNEPSIVPGPETSYASYGRPWANLSNTPFRLYKKWVHEGGIAAPFIVRWPAGNVVAGGLVRTPHQLTHIVPTLLDAVGIAPDDRPALPARGFLDELTHGDAAESQTLFWEHCGNAAVRRGRWKLVRRFGHPWELYDLATDPTELNDVLDGHRELAEDLYHLWVEWSHEVGVQPFERIVDLYDIRGGGEPAAAR
jgi:arylsulfatase